MGTNNNNQNNGNDPCGGNRDVLCQYKTALINEVKELFGKADASETLKETKEAVRDSKVCCVLKADETSRFYRNIDFYVAIDANSKAEQIAKNVDEIVKRSENLTKAIGEMVKLIKNLKTKSRELKDKACELDTQIKDSCNQQQLNILNSQFSSDKAKCSVKRPGTEKGFMNFTEIASYIESGTKVVWKNADDAFKNAVSISGIQTFSNLKSLKELSKTMATCANEFKKNIDENVKNSTEDLKKAQEELAASVKEVSLKTVEGHKETTLYEGAAFALEFVCDPECCSNESISKLCAEVTRNSCGDVKEVPTDPCGEAYTVGNTN